MTHYAVKTDEKRDDAGEWRETTMGLRTSTGRREAVVYPVCGLATCGVRINEYPWQGGERWQGGELRGMHWPRGEAEAAALAWVETGAIPGMKP